MATRRDGFTIGVPDAMHAQAEATNRNDAMLHTLTFEMKSLQDLISGHPGLLVKITIQAMEY